MNRDDVLETLIRYLQAILYHDLFFAEIVNLVSMTGSEAKFFKLLGTRLNLLAALGIDVVKAKEFENIGKGLYSMHFANSGFNYRILFSFLPNRQPVLLLAFHERAGKRKTDYSSYIEPALSRLDEMKEDFENGF